MSVKIGDIVKLQYNWDESSFGKDVVVTDVYDYTEMHKPCINFEGMISGTIYCGCNNCRMFVPAIKKSFKMKL